MLKKILLSVLVLIVLAVVYAAYYGIVVRKPQLSEQIPAIDKTRDAKLLTAFFGLDALPAQALLLHYRAMGKNGMPLVFSQEIDPSTLDNTDIAVTTEKGEVHLVDIVTLKPANEYFELRTVLLIGEYGTYPDNPPVSVEIVGDIMSRSGQNYKGQQIEVIPLPDGPTISYAEHFVFDDAYPYVEKGMGCDCPKESTAMVVRTVWAGGVRAIDGAELGDRELDDFEVTLVSEGDTISISPYKIADLRDGDNNIDLCLNKLGTPILVRANAGIAIDPRDDANPMTSCTVVSRW